MCLLLLVILSLFWHESLKAARLPNWQVALMMMMMMMMMMISSIKILIAVFRVAAFAFT